MQQSLHSGPDLGEESGGWQPDFDEDYGTPGQQGQTMAGQPISPLPYSTFDPAQNVLIEQGPERAAASVPTRQALPLVPSAINEVIPPVRTEINRPETLIELGPFRAATSLPTLQAPLTMLPSVHGVTPEPKAIKWWEVVGRIVAFMLTLALLTFLFRKIWLLWALIWAASIFGIIIWHRQRRPRYGPIGGILEFNFEIVLGVLWLLGNFILALIGLI